MAANNTEFEGGGFRFNITAIGDWVSENIWLFLLLVVISYIFFVSRKDGLASKFLDYRAKIRQIDANRMESLRQLATVFERRFGPDEPLLPFLREKEEGDE